jgi:hypothetical protein
MIILHHGSYTNIDSIDLSKSKPGKDFGKGFYLNPDYDQALLWAESRVRTLQDGKPTVTSYEFDIDRAQQAGIKVKVFNDYTAEWAEFVVGNRRNTSDIPYHTFDIVIGPIADDNVGRQIQLYMQGYWSIEQLIDRIKYTSKKSMQYFFGSVEALTYLTKIS